MDPKVNELLATIRKSVEGDVNSLGAESRGTLMRGALREMRVRMDGGPSQAIETPPSAVRHEELSRLRERILRNVERNELLAASQGAAAYGEQGQHPGRQARSRNDFSSIMALPSPHQQAAELRPGYAQQEADDARYYEEQQWNEAQHNMHQSPHPGVNPGGYHEPLLSEQAEAATEQAFRHLSDTLLARAAGDRNLEDMTRDMLRGMIKQWLDANLATLVEGLVREEIERVARRGR
jgi:cell pole-organizing protein PopZ